MILMSEVVQTTQEGEEGIEVQAEVVAHAEASEGVLGQFGLRTDLFLAQLVNFVIVMLVLWKFAYKPIMAMLDAREKKIAESVKTADEIAARLKAVEDERVDILKTARIEAQSLVEQAIQDSEDRKHEMIEAAKREVERVIMKGKEQLSTERDAMLLEVRKDLVDIAVRAAAKIALETVNEKKSKSLAEEVVRKLT